MRALLLLFCVCLCTPVGAQVTYPPVDPAVVATKAELAAKADAAAVATKAELAAKADAATAATKAEVAVVAGSIPKPATSVPSADMMTTGKMGTVNEFRRPDDQAPRISRVIKGVVTGANGTAAVTWATMTSVPGLTITVYVAANATAVPECKPVIGTVTTTGATVKCFEDQSILGLGLLPRKIAGAGVTFDVLALP